jgi:PKHD-type hydroxylase
MKQYYVRRVLDHEQLKVVHDIINESNQHNFWNDGLYSGGGTRSVKSNVELNTPQFSQTINDMIMSSLDGDKGFHNFTSPSNTNLNIISKTVSGGYYNPHFDNWNNGDYSTTVFLNDPSEYDGGELCLYIGGEDEEKIKLDAGWAVTYSTGTIHRVNKVVRGTRYVSVFWTKSLISDPFIRFIHGELGNIQDKLPINEHSVHLSTCISALNDPYFLLNNLKTQILRRYAS